MPNMDHQPGLLGHSLATSDGTHMYHAGKPAKIAYTHPQEQALLDEGYGYEYIPQEYPKVLALEARPGVFRYVTVKSADEETVLRGRGRALESNHPEVIGDLPQSTVQVVHEATGIASASALLRESNVIGEESLRTITWSLSPGDFVFNPLVSSDPAPPPPDPPPARETITPTFSPVIPPAPIERLADPTVVGPLVDAKEHSDPVPVALKAPVEEDTN